MIDLPFTLVREGALAPEIHPRVQAVALLVPQMFAVTHVRARMKLYGCAVRIEPSVRLE